MSTELIESTESPDNIAVLILNNAEWQDGDWGKNEPGKFIPMEPAKLELLEKKILEMIDAGSDINQKIDKWEVPDTGIRPLQAIIESIPNVSVEFVQKIIDKGADVNAYFCEDDYYDNFMEGDYNNDYWGFDAYDGDLCMYAPLHIAAEKNRTDIMHILIKAGANVNLKAGNDEKVPLDFAKTEETRKVLLDAGADESLTQD